MLIQAAEDSYKRGMHALSDGTPLEALAWFEAAIELERRYEVDVPQARYLSFYGLCLGLSGKRLREAARLCRAAIQIEEFNADLRLNLGRVLLEANRRREAYRALRAGRALDADHRGIQRLLAGMGRRRRPPIPFLARGNPLNVLLGRMRATPRANPVRRAA